MKPILFLIMISLASCSKEYVPPIVQRMGLQEVEVNVTQVKSVVTIIVDAVPRDYDRAITIETSYGSQKLYTVLYIKSNETKVQTSFSINATITGYRIYSFGKHVL